MKQTTIEKIKAALTVVLVGVALSAGYIALCRIMRGYWALAGDFLVIGLGVMAAAMFYSTVHDFDAQKDFEDCEKGIGVSSETVERTETGITGRTSSNYSDYGLPEDAPMYLKVMRATGAIRKSTK